MAFSKEAFTESVSRIAADYEKSFKNRDECGTPTNPLEYHLYHLARYWSRLLRFQEFQEDSDGTMDDNIGACIQVGSERAHSIVGPDSPIFDIWQEYWWRTSILLQKRPTTMELINAAHASFEACLSKLQYDPWERSKQFPIGG